MHFKFNITSAKGPLTIVNEVFPIDIEGHPNAIAGISIVVNDIEE